METRTPSGGDDRSASQPGTPRRLAAGIRNRKGLAAFIAAGLVVSLVGGTLAWRLGQPVPRVAAVASPSPASVPASAAVATPPPTAARNGIATLEATNESGGVVALDASFRLTSLDGSPAADLAKHVVVKPVVQLETVADAGPNSVRLVPAEPLVAGAVYRFALLAEDGRLLDTWAFQAHQGVRVVSTLPANEATDVPVDSGIEITFDQDGLAGAEDHVTIDPPTKGRFEQHGRVLVFVPTALAPATAYAVTISSGITVAATGEASTQSTTFRFETAGTDVPMKGWLEPQDDLVESATAARPTLAFWVVRGDEAYRPPKSIDVQVYRFPSMDAAIAAFQSGRSWQWARLSAAGLTKTTSLTRVLSADLPLQPYGDAVWAALPKPLPAGWYLVQAASGRRPIQTVLQVTDLSAYLAVSDTNTMVWANDVSTGKPVSAAAVVAEGRELGRTGSDGLLTAHTPERLLPASRTDCRVDCEPVLSVSTSDGRAAILPVTGRVDQDRYDDAFSWYYNGNPRYWTVFNTDRTLFRPSDEINAWGMLRNRDSGDVPERVVLRLVPRTDEPQSVAPAVATLEVQPRESGVFAGTVRLTGIPIGSYSLQLVAGDAVVSTLGIQVGQILKPAYRVEVETGHRVYIQGDRIRVTVKTSFYDESPVPGVPMRVSADFLNGTVTTDATGTGEIRSTAKVSEYNEGQPDFKVLYATAARAEEAEIAGASPDFIVFPSSRTIDAKSEVSGGRVQVAGGVNVVDQERLEKEIRGGASVYEVDPRGKAVSGAHVTVRFVELVPVRGEGRQEYDFLQKKVVTVYDYQVEEREAGTETVRTDTAGRFSASIAAGRGDHDYNVHVSVADPDGGVARTWVYATGIVPGPGEHRSAALESTDRLERNGDEYAVGEPIDLTFRGPTPNAREAKFLFFGAQRGVRSAVVQSAPRFVAKFEAADAPGITYYGVRFNGSGYEAAEFTASFQMSDRALDVRLSTASSHLEPGDDVTVDVAVRDASGKPRPSTVVVRVVDEKLYTIDAAQDVDVLRSLYVPVSTGVRMTYWSHRLPHGETGGGDTGGGGDTRTDFRDSLLFKVVDTDAEGRASVSFKLSDDLTSWRVSAAALTADLRAGDSALQLPVGLPFFVDATIAPEYLTSDRPTILVRTFGTALKAGDVVSISADGPSLGLQAGPLKGKAFESVAIALPALRPGRHEITIRAKTGSGASARTDGVTRTFVVVDSRLTRSASAQVEITSSTHLRGGDGLTTVVVSDAGASRHLQLLLDLASSRGGRLDTSLAAATASSILVDRFGMAPEGLPPTEYSPEMYQAPDGGLALLPYSSSDLELSAMAAIAGRQRIDGPRVEGYLRSIYENATETRERRTIALAGRAALGAPVLPELRALSTDASLTIREQLFIGIGLARVGDSATARIVIDDLVGRYGEEVDGRIRLRVGSSADDIASATALMAVLTASVGDPRAPQFWDYVDENQPGEVVLDLPAVAYVAATFDWQKLEPARFSWTLGAEHEVVDLPPGETATFSLTGDQLADFTIERLDGAVGVSTSWREQVEPGAFGADPDVSIKRTVTPGDTVGSSDIIMVRLLVTFSRSAADGCHEVRDHVPSGLMPVGSLAAWVDPNSGEPRPTFVLPYFQGNQIVRWCAEPTRSNRTVELRYYARVITPGRYEWEPAVADSRTVQGRAALTSATTILIR